MSTFKQVSIPIFPVTAYPPASSYKLYSYVAGTTTKQATYTDSTGNTQNANPATIQAGSSAPVYLTVFCQVGQSYKFVLAPSTDTDPPTSPLWTVDNLQTDDNLDLTPYASISNSILTLINTSLTNPKISTKILDLNGNTLFTFTPTLAAINNYAITNQITGVSPTIQVSGDTNRNARLLGAGTGGVNLGSPSGTTPLILEPGSTTNTQSHTMTLTAPRTVTWADASFTVRSMVCDFIGSAIASSSASLSISGLSATYSTFVVIFQDIRSATDNVSAIIQFNGDTGSNYKYANQTMSMAGTPSLAQGGSSGTTSWGISGNFGNGVNDLLGGSLIVVEGATRTQGNWQTVADDGATVTTSNGGGVWFGTQPVTSVQLKMTSGNITSGSMYVYGLRAA